VAAFKPDSGVAKKDGRARKQDEINGIGCLLRSSVLLVNQGPADYSSCLSLLFQGMMTFRESWPSHVLFGWYRKDVKSHVLDVY
jgi:hypothetical protein